MKHAIALLALGLVGMSLEAQVTKAAFGTTKDGKAVDIYTLKDASLEVKIITYGARIQSVLAPDSHGKVGNVVLGAANLDGYVNDGGTYFGAVVGRYGNRIAKGQFTIDGKTFHVPINNNGQSLHGGTDGFSARVWTAKVIPEGVEMTLVSPDGDQGYPGELTAHVRYTLKGHALQIAYSATTTKATVLNLTNHSYFNLGGEGNGTIVNHKVQIDADRYTPVDSVLIPTGDLPPVAGTPFDFRTPHTIGERVDTKNDQLKLGGGYDHNWVLNGKSGVLRTAAVVSEPTSGRTLTVSTTEPGVQFYTGNSMKDGVNTGTGGAKYVRRGGFCLETQHFPDSPNHPAFPSTLLKPGQTFHSMTVFTFGVTK
ncbi:galactose mutarotase-like enzyme [Terriglobus roseus DSM 18391]|uniref:Aldose 1-epimerase n=1 Tax=Terriglobus roseus (strain DSM 18391 / NRRL B-41598 / KBS 63) TaxID=926566 RepID=I3ZHJ6_TERRK|nr:aldose epimerase family protein [Terriglobus roseus]AFL88372.1 galactose mutarotase-like enzyme [Terriglobus roseus DSM 18391]AFL88714.1 galactose mutarotase-like enzyme [Terriglobus roseus DSM 18391]